MLCYLFNEFGHAYQQLHRNIPLFYSFIRKVLIFRKLDIEPLLIIRLIFHDLIILFFHSKGKSYSSFEISKSILIC